jgi:enamine deaminase RidA (YjgF/YER057c/UK114 family)
MVVAKQVLLDDPLHRGLPAVVRSGPFLFMSSVDGDRDHRSGLMQPDRFGDGPAQARAAYSAVVDRLTECGFDGRTVVRVEHATSSQDWRLQRMALWPEIFGTPTQAVTQGYQGKMAGQNMITVAAVAAVPGTDRRVVSPGPSDQRGARVVQCGSYTFVIGVRGEQSLATGARAPEEVEGAFVAQADHCYDNIEFHLRAAGSEPEQLVRFDGFVRSIPQMDATERARAARYGSRVTAASTTVASPLGGRTDLELSAIAARPGVALSAFELDELGRPRAVVSGDLGFLSGVWGDRGERGEPAPSTFGRFDRQLDAALGQLEHGAALTGGGLQNLLRLDVYVTDPYRWDVIDDWLVTTFGDRGPVVVRHGVELGPTAMVALSAVVSVSSQPVQSPSMT